MTWTLAATAAGTILGALVYGALAWVLWHRDGDAGTRTAMRAFGFYWAMTATYQGLVGAQHALAAGGFAPLAFEVFVRYLGLALASAGLAGLLSFFAYLLTGNRAWLRRIAIAYVGVALLGWLHVWRSRPVAVELTDWSVDVAYAGDFQSGLFAPLMVMLLLVPILAAGWYATLARKTTDAGQRYRILAVGIGVGMQLLGFLIARIVENEMWHLISRVVFGILVAGLIFSAYFSTRELVGPAGTPTPGHARR